MEGDEKMNELSMSNAKTKLTVWILVIMIFAGAFYWFLIKPQFDQINILKNQINEKEQKLATLLLAQKREKVLLDENNKMEDRIAQLQRILPTQPNEFLFGEEFQVIAKLCGVKIDSLTFGKKGKKGVPPNTVTFNMSVSASKLQNINYFFTHLAIFPQIINLDRVSLQKGLGQSYSGLQNTEVAYSLTINGVIYLSQRK